MNNVYQLRYSTHSDRIVMGDDELHCGDCFLVLCINNNLPEWNDFRIEYSDKLGRYLLERSENLSFT